MKKLIKNSIVWFWSQRAFEDAYLARQTTNPSEKNRNMWTMLVASALFAFTLAFILIMAWLRQDVGTYLSKQKDIYILKSTDWYATKVLGYDCMSSGAFNCYQKLQGVQKYTADIKSYTLERKKNDAYASSEVLMLSTKLKTSWWKSLNSRNALALTFPKINFRKIDLYLNGILTGSFYEGDQIVAYFSPEEYLQESLQADLVVQLRPMQPSLMPIRMHEKNFIETFPTVMSKREYSRYQEFLAADKVGRGNYVGHMARICMAILVLVLFMIVDGSPESLGLAMLLGFEGIAISTLYDWLPFDATFLKNFCYQMGDVFRLFFFLQLARMIPKNVLPWLLIGSLLSVPYGIAWHYGLQHEYWFIYRLPRYRDIIIGSIGLIVCLRTAYLLRGKDLNWRVAALLIASIGAFEQVVEPIFAYFPELKASGPVSTLIDILQPISTWMLAFSAFINIGTLEKRVKQLSKIEAKAIEIEHEMELGRTVQKSFLNTPELPKFAGFKCYHEAMLYVSGDTYFVNWNDQHEKLTFLINDVTGHGIQAALKASAANVIADAIWNGQTDDDKWRENKLQAYSMQVQRYLNQISDDPDIIAIGGAEFDAKTGIISLFRVNFPFPLIIEPTTNLSATNEVDNKNYWNTRFLPLSNAKFHKMQIKPGSFFVITSDGFIDTSRRAKDFLKYLKQKLASRDLSLNATDIEELYLSCDLFENNRQADDRTLLVFQWKPENSVIETPIDFPSIHSVA
ncbi:MAG: SpoIIE family protein phosphatase [Bdellovibrionota bacterium]